ncbi:MAG: sirohydrochlorin chelatase [Nocardioidaceae bacterium]
MTAPARPALVAVSHGTADPAGTAAVSGLVEAVAGMVDVPVGEAHVDVHGPYVADVVAERGGAAVVVPLLLAAGYHVRVDVAEAVAPWPAARVAEALGPDPRLTGVLADRLREAGAGPDDVVVLAAAGSSDDRADASVRNAAADLAASWGSPVAVAYGAARSPRVPCAVARARIEHPGRRVVLASYLLAPGFFQRRLARAGADLVTAPLLGPDRPPDPRLVDLVVERFRDAVRRGGD